MVTHGCMVLQTSGLCVSCIAKFALLQFTALGGAAEGGACHLVWMVSRFLVIRVHSSAVSEPFVASMQGRGHGDITQCLWPGPSPALPWG